MISLSNNEDRSGSNSSNLATYIHGRFPELNSYETRACAYNKLTNFGGLQWSVEAGSNAFLRRI